MTRIRPWLYASLSLFALSSIACGDDAETGGGGTNGVGGTNATGGTGGTAGGPDGGGGSGTAGGGPEAPECVFDDDCVINSDCCECAGRPVGELPPECALDCDIDTCTALGILDFAFCTAGRCVTNVSCHVGPVFCNTPPPDCPAGSAPIVDGECYTGECLPVVECTGVTDCSDCVGSPETTCLTFMGDSPHCVDLLTCDDADCACLGPSVCIDPSFNVCSESAQGIDCSSP